MSTVKISELPEIPRLNDDTTKTLIVGVDSLTNITGSITAKTLAQTLFSHDNLNVGNNTVLLPNTIAQFAGSAETYLQVNLENNEANGTADYVITADVGTDLTNYLDLGFTNSTYDNSNPNNSLGTSIEPLSGYLYVQGDDNVGTGNLVLGTTNTGTEVRFIAGGVNSENVVAKVTESGLELVNQFPVIFNDGTRQYTSSAPYAYSNAAFSKANSAFASQNTTGSYANAAYAKANSAGIYANGAFSTANVALDQIATQSLQISSAASYANSAFIAANNAIANTNNINIPGKMTVSGMLAVNNSTFGANTSALAITGSTDFARQMPANDGYMLHITGKDNVPTRVIVDSFGPGNTYSLFSGRSGRGTAAAPTSTQANDIIARYSSSSYGGSTGFLPFGTGRIDFVATENHTDTNRGTQIQLWSMNNGSNTLTQTATLSGSVAAFPGTITANNVTIPGTVQANTFIGNTTFANVSVQNQVANTILFYPQYVSPTQTPGQLWYDPSVQRVVLDSDITGDRVGLGRVMYERVYNSTGSTLPANYVVRLTGQITPNLIPYVVGADNSSYANTQVSGIILNPIANGAYGYVYLEGLMVNANTLNYVTGDVLYLSPTTGVFSNVAPNNNGTTLQVGKVVVGANSTQGKIRVEFSTRPSAGKTNGSVLYANNSLTYASNTLNVNEVSAILNVAGTLNVTGNVTVTNTGLFRYNSSTGNATVTQLTSKTTSVICNGRTGQITTSNSNIPNARVSSFTVNNNFITSAQDVVIVNIASGGSTSSYAVSVTNVTPGSFDISIANISGGGLAETLVINFAVIRVN